MRRSEEDIRFPGWGDEEIGGRIARPAGPGPCPAVVVALGPTGPSGRASGLCRRFADAGFVALAPGLRWTEEGVPDARARGDLDAAARWLAALPEVRTGAVGAVGFGIGGTLAFDLACGPDSPLRACVDFCGDLRAAARGAPGNLDRVGELRGPVLGIFGGSDDRIPLRDVLALKESLAGRGHAIAYPRAGHGFMDDASPAHRPDDAADAWRRTLLFLRERLAPDSLPPDAAPAVPEYPPPPRRRPRHP